MAPLSFILVCSILLCMTCFISAFQLRSNPMVRPTSTACFGFPRPIHKEFTVEKATEEMKESLNVNSWSTWSTEGSAKYKVGIKSPKKVYDTNELSYIISGKMEITPEETGVPVVVQAGDFVTFPDGFACYWYVIEPIVKRWFLY